MVKREAPEEFERIKNGETTVSEAYRKLNPHLRDKHPKREADLYDARLMYKRGYRNCTAPASPGPPWAGSGSGTGLWATNAALRSSCPPCSPVAGRSWKPWLWSRLLLLRGADRIRAHPASRLSSNA
jgi:hypothetical protein